MWLFSTWADWKVLQSDISSLYPYLERIYEICSDGIIPDVRAPVLASKLGFCACYEYLSHDSVELELGKLAKYTWKQMFMACLNFFFVLIIFLMYFD